MENVPYRVVMNIGESKFFNIGGYEFGIGNQPGNQAGYAGERTGSFDGFAGHESQALSALAADNHVMQDLLVKNGFSYCGRILLANGSPRLAYHRPARRPE